MGGEEGRDVLAEGYGRENICKRENMEDHTAK